MPNMNVNYRCRLYMSNIHVFLSQGGDIARSKHVDIDIDIDIHVVHSESGT